ncbi:uncharacterized protein LOC111994518 [Quercus suber]|uniref:uncharacterized protein LOC111994518 n=1 Tax=Quercus suber TaxID=58331 RepID=UPI0032DEEDB8
MSEVRSSELETGLSSNGGPVDEDTAVSGSREVRAFYAQGEGCGLDADTLARFRDRFQFPNRVRVRLPSVEDRACHFFPGKVCFYEAAFICGLRFPVHPFLMELLHYFGIASGQLMPNSWRILISCMGIWLAANDGDMIRVDELVYLYRLKALKEYGYYELVPWERGTRIVKKLPSSFRYWKSRFFYVSGNDFETPSGEVWGDLPVLRRRWETPTLVKRRPKLKSRYRERVQKAIKYTQTIENWDDLVNPKTLAFFCIGPEPSAFVLKNLDIEGKKKMTSKFNKDMNAKMRAKKSEPLSNIGKKTVRVVGKGLSATPPSSVTPILSGTETTRTASPSTSVEELPTPVAKRPRLTGKEKEKEVEDAGRSSVWSNEKLAVDRAHTIVTADDLKVFSGVPFNTVAGGHVHKLVQALGESLHIASEYLTQEAKLASLVSKVQALENENS